MPHQHMAFVARLARDLNFVADSHFPISYSSAQKQIMRNLYQEALENFPYAVEDDPRAEITAK